MFEFEIKYVFYFMITVLGDSWLLYLILWVQYNW